MYLRIFTTIVLIIYLMVLGYGALSPDVVKYFDGTSDKLLHFTEFFILSILVFALLSSFNVRWKTLICIVSCSLLAVGSEFVQLSIKTRSFDYLDMVADAGGFLLGIVFCWVVVWIFYK